MIPPKVSREQSTALALQSALDILCEHAIDACPPENQTTPACTKALDEYQAVGNKISVQFRPGPRCLAAAERALTKTSAALQQTARAVGRTVEILQHQLLTTCCATLVATPAPASETPCSSDRSVTYVLQRSRASAACAAGLSLGDDSTHNTLATACSVTLAPRKTHTQNSSARPEECLNELITNGVTIDVR